MQFSSAFKNDILDTCDQNFEEKCIKVFQYQSRKCLPYKRFIEALKINPYNIASISDIPFLPISFFKTQRVACFPASNIQRTFESSGTSGVTTSKHEFDDVQFYHKTCVKTFEAFYGPLIDYEVFALLPSYIERGTSSLTSMADHFIKLSKTDLGGFYLNDLDSLLLNIKRVLKIKRKILLIGVTFALLDFAQKFSGEDLSDIIIMETGGMKGRREEMTRPEVHAELKKAFSANSIHSEYGMTELLSQAYSKGNGIFSTPPWMRITLRDLNDPLNHSNTLTNGAINIIDLANINTCSFIATQDLGKKINQNDFEILGRIDNSDIRGCNLLVIE